MRTQISFVIDNTKYFTAFGAEGLLSDHLVDTNAIKQTDIVGSAALTRSFGRLVPGGMMSVPVITVSEYTKDGEYFLLKGTCDGTDYELTKDGVIVGTDFKESEPVEEAQSAPTEVISEEKPVTEPESETEAEPVEEKAFEPEPEHVVQKPEPEPETIKEEVPTGREQVEASEKTEVVEDTGRENLKELLKTSKAGLKFGKRKENVALGLQLGSKGDMGFLFRANVVQGTSSQSGKPYHRTTVQRKSITGRPIVQYDEPLPRGNKINPSYQETRQQQQQAPITEPVKPEVKPVQPVRENARQPVEPATITPEHVTPKPVETPRSSGIPASWKRNAVEQVSAPKESTPANTTRSTSSNYLNDLFHGGIKEESGSFDVSQMQAPKPIETTPVIEEPKVPTRVKDVLSVALTAEEKKAQIDKLLSEQSEEIRSVLQQAPMSLFGDAVRQFTIHPVDMEKLNAEGISYCIDTRWFKCGDWFAIDVVPHTARYLYNNKLNVSVEIPRSVHRKYFDLNKQE